MSYYTMHESTVTRKNFDVAMSMDGTLAVEELQDAIAAAEVVCATSPGETSNIRVTIVDDTIRIYFDITERK